ncbi:hypothetical protein KIN20_028773 [Parelaphostrongylus tenuis]|uniref:DAGKc domain-containing protein n=1 Tax=Parelaphostrongylus tenuis TaxID=148309 RepID=A0AAD5R1A0_PARTN|nr:hypothetical protein KIN20_028773 [Parelaphostrongylus tenuis]
MVMLAVRQSDSIDGFLQSSLFGTSMHQCAIRVRVGLQHLRKRSSAKDREWQNFKYAYALKAREYGRATVYAEERPRRLLFSVNNAANERSSYDDFVKNALPLLHLAGIQVDVIKSDSESQMEALAAAVDTQEVRCHLCSLGDGTLRRVVTGFYSIGRFQMGVQYLGREGRAPSGCDARRGADGAEPPPPTLPAVNQRNVSTERHNQAYNTRENVFTDRIFWEVTIIYHLRRLVPDVFESSRDVRRMCESAMALIVDERRNVNAFGFTVRSPADMEAKLQYEEICPGCQTCHPPVLFEPPTWRWWHILTGSARYPED